MVRRMGQRDISFSASPGGDLKRTVTKPDGGTYTQRCTRETFVQVAKYLDTNPAGFTAESAADHLRLPLTQTHIAIELLKERGMLEMCGRRHYIDEGYRDGIFEHAMTEFCAIIEGHPPEHQPPKDSD